MSHRIVVSRSWCKECLRDCFQAYDEANGEWTHVGPETLDLADYSKRLQTQGYWVSQRNRIYTFTCNRFKTATAPDPLLAYIEAREQDW